MTQEAANGPTRVGTAFDPVAADYDSYRPAYPAELFETIDAYAGGLAGARVLDLAAGTGIATRSLLECGAQVVATDLGADMLRVLRTRTPGAPALQARGETLPLRDAAVDVITCATAWHWIPPDRRGPEAYRVLRPGGTLAIWWAFGGIDGDEVASTREREIYEKWGVGEREPVTTAPDATDPTEELPDHRFVEVLAHDIKGTREVSVGDHVGHLSTHSPVLALRSDLPGFRADLFAAFDGYRTVTEQVFCHLVLARRP